MKLSLSHFIRSAALKLKAKEEGKSTDFEDYIENYSKTIREFLPTHYPENIDRPKRKYTLEETLTTDPSDVNLKIEDRSLYRAHEVLIGSMNFLIEKAYNSEQKEKYTRGKHFEEGLEIVMDFLKETGDFKPEELKALRDFTIRTKGRDGSVPTKWS